MVDEWPDDMPETQTRVGKIKIHTRDTLKTTATQALTTDVYTQIVRHSVETSSLMAAGATVEKAITADVEAVRLTVCWDGKCDDHEVGLFAGQ